MGSGSSTSRCGLPFIKLHKLCSYLVAVTGVLILLLPNILLPITWPIVLIAVIVSWFYEGERLHEERYRRRWTSFTAVVFFGSLFLLLLRIIQNPIQLACYLLLFLLVNKLFNRRTNRDYLHIYLLSFLMLTLSTILNSELSYAVCFVMYVVFLTWSLTLFHSETHDSLCVYARVSTTTTHADASAARSHCACQPVLTVSWMLCW